MDYGAPLGLILGWFCLAPPAADSATSEILLSASDPRITYSGFVQCKLTADGAMGFDRLVDVGGRGYRWDSPGTRISFRTDAPSIVTRLRYSEKHLSPGARNGVGLIYVDGATRPEWMFRRRTPAKTSPIENIEVDLPVPAGGGFHDYALVLPYGEAVEFLGARLGSPASIVPRPVTTPFRYVAFGDSVTHGYTATDVGKTYPWLIAARRGCELINMGYAGRRTVAADGRLIADRGADMITVLIGVNDWQTGTEPEEYRRNLGGLIAGIRALQPVVPVYVITSLWVSPKWRPKAAKYPLERYREVARAVVADAKDAHLFLVEGSELIDHDERFFDPVLVHPNDAGFALMAGRLDALLRGR